ncbi:MAG: MFS transporter [Candidatus Bathyarchaeota archaeon]|nr:MAG: MFS transporter [Candidatus Bathyarchaeota archaeon]
MKSNSIRFLTFAAIMASWAYLSIFARDLGISDPEIGFIVAAYSLALFSSSFIFGRASDRYGRKLFLLVGLALSSLAFFLQIFAHNFLGLLLTRVLTGFCVGIFPASLIALVHENNKDLSRFSSFGSMGWTLGLLMAGLIAFYLSIESVFAFSSLLFIPAFLVASKMKFGEHHSVSVPAFPIKIIKKNLPLYLSVLIRHSGAHMVWTFWPLFLQTLGADRFWVAVIQAINGATQSVFMFTLSQRIGYTSSVAGGLLLAGATFFSFALVADFWQIMPAQVLLGVSWSLLYVGGLRYLMDRNVEKATVSGLFDSALSLSSIIGPLIGAIIVSFGSYRITMYLASALAFIGFLLFRFLKRNSHFV